MQAGLRQIPILTLLLLGLPMLGVYLSGASLHPYFEFPPRTHYIVHAGFSWPVFAATATVGVSTLAAMLWLLVRDRKLTVSVRKPVRTGGWPWWGWPGWALLLTAWLLAWNRFSWFADWQWATFTPVWLGYILVINAWTFRRQKQCLLSHQPGYFLLLFPLSALFWWYFEYLNRFVQNWFYIGIDDFGSWQYALHATTAFSTVLPAVLSTQQWLRSMLSLSSRPVPLVMRPGTVRKLALGSLSVASAALILIGVFPNLLFPFLWLAPLLLVPGLQGLRGEPGLLRELRARGWQTIYLPALAALQCGFLWELWNFHSAAKWVYAVPFVDRFHVFEMPLLGFTGYLPFGIECLAIALLLRR